MERNRCFLSSWSVVVCGLVLLLAVGCWRARPSEIVVMVERAGAGDVRNASVASMVRWFHRHPAVALKANDLCSPLRRNALLKWPETTEGRVCDAASQVAGFIIWQKALKESNEHEIFQGGSR
jgi:hypothetical protein